MVALVLGENDTRHDVEGKPQYRRFKRMYVMCPPKFSRIGNECYFISPNKQNWLDAYFECKDHNSKLAEPMKYEDKHLRKYLQKINRKNYFTVVHNIYDCTVFKYRFFININHNFSLSVTHNATNTSVRRPMDRRYLQLEAKQMAMGSQWTRDRVSIVQPNDSWVIYHLLLLCF
uniref:C-type lectin domain-containing protein n=1 Tax=Anopheles maculatus TaxID=74869 RepID=A0A182STM6_9DIPT